MNDIVMQRAIEYATSTVENPEEHHDAVFTTANDFSEGANWMLDRVCEFMKSELHNVEVFSENGESSHSIKEEKIVFVDDNSAQDFLIRLREAIIKGNE